MRSQRVRVALRVAYRLRRFPAGPHEVDAPDLEKCNRLHNALGVFADESALRDARIGRQNSTNCGLLKTGWFRATLSATVTPNEPRIFNP